MGGVVEEVVVEGVVRGNELFLELLYVSFERDVYLHGLFIDSVQQHLKVTKNDEGHCTFDEESGDPIPIPNIVPILVSRWPYRYAE